MQRTIIAIVSIGFLMSGVCSRLTCAQESEDLIPVPFEQGVANLSPSNTMIQFIGAHAGDEPNPRVGNFQRFTGQARLDSSGAALESISVEIETDSLFTQIPNLTNHLKSPDFLDAREFPSAKFQTSKITPIGNPNQYEVTGELTLHGTTKPLKFPATITVANSAVTLQADLSINRSEYGMNQLTDRVVDKVDLNLAIGKAAPTLAQVNAGRGQFDPMEFFRQRDANKDQKLAGEELTDRLQASIADFDTDNDGAISLEEFEVRLQTIDARRDGGGRRPRNE